MILFDFLTSMGNVIMFLPPVLGAAPLGQSSPVACSVLAATLGNAAQQASILFYLCVVINMLLTMIRKSTEETTENFRKFISNAVIVETICVGVYVVSSTSYLAGMGAFGAVNQNSERFECWINIPWGRLFLYVPLMITMFVAAGSLLFIYLQGSRRMMPAAWKYTSRRIMLFVVVFLCLWTVPTICRVYEIVQPDWDAPDWLLIVVKTLFGLNGLVNALVWTTSRPFLNVYMTESCCCYSFFKCCCGSCCSASVSAMSTAHRRRETTGTGSTGGSHSVRRENSYLLDEDLLDSYDNDNDDNEV
tara:strand:- start:63 stop:974 length:912 start_codon:yes stop_codon:yes gene_type:complete